MRCVSERGSRNARSGSVHSYYHLYPDEHAGFTLLKPGEAEETLNCLSRLGQE